MNYIAKLKTKFFVGSYILDKKQFFDKINEIIDWLKGDSVGSYKSYVALLTQTSTNAPVATVVSNTLSGTPVWSYTAQGVYTVTLTGAFTANKTVIVKAALPGITQVDFSGNITSAEVLHTITDTSNIVIATFVNATVSTDDWLSSYPFEIRVYK